MNKRLKNILRRIHYKSNVARYSWFLLRFIKNNRYIPNFKNPKTYNEKINFRKNNPEHELFSICADKILVKDWVAEMIGQKYIIPTYCSGDYITPAKVKQIIAEKGDCLIKANHNSGPVQLLTASSTESEIENSCNCINSQLIIDYGRLQNERWYSKIRPKILVEKRLDPEKGDSDLKDYKFHVFKQDDGSFKVLLHIDFDRGSNHNRSFFDENLNYLPFQVKYPSIKTAVSEPDNYEIMLELAKTLAKPFSYVRVDFYNINGDIYFGEMTFAPGSGCSSFTNYDYDLWMGNHWKGDPRY